MYVPSFYRLYDSKLADSCLVKLKRLVIEIYPKVCSREIYVERSCVANYKLQNENDKKDCEAYIREELISKFQKLDSIDVKYPSTNSAKSSAEGGGFASDDTNNPPVNDT
jgi:hypothetical protein